VTTNEPKEDTMREYPHTIPAAYEADEFMAEAYDSGWRMAARLEGLAMAALRHRVWTSGASPNRDLHRDVWIEVASEHRERRDLRFEGDELSRAFDDGALDAIEAGLAEFTDADYLGSDQ
jgi:hypothetical protein